VAQKRTEARQQTAHAPSWKPRDAALPPQSDGLGARFAESLWASPIVRVVVRSTAVLVALSSVFFVVSAIVELIQGGSKTEPGVLAGLAVFFAGTCVGSGWVAWKAFRPGRRGPVILPETPEQRILALASTEAGRVTVAEVAATCHLDLDDAKQELDKLVLKHAAQMEVTDEGVLVYELVGFLSDEEKERAKGL
jgi:hypothetical protein